MDFYSSFWTKVLRLSFPFSPQIKLVNINIPDIIDGKPSIILGLIWTIILQYHVGIMFTFYCLFLFLLFKSHHLFISHSSHFYIKKLSFQALVCLQTSVIHRFSAAAPSLILTLVHL